MHIRGIPKNWYGILFVVSFRQQTATFDYFGLEMRSDNKLRQENG